MKLKIGMGFLGTALLLFCGCDDSTGASNAKTDEPVVRDSVVIRDSVKLVDSVHVVDSVKIVDSVRTNVLDSVNMVDSVRVVDSVRIIDSVRIVDSLNIVDSIHVIDSVNVIDSIHVVDSIHVIENVRDSVAVHDPEYYFGECTAENAGVIKSTTINEKVRDFICDKMTLLWRAANKVDWNDKFIYDSHVEDFTPVKTVIDDLAEDEKLVVVLRHAERGDDYSMTGPLNDNGMKQSFSLGETLAGDLDFYYGASQFVRAHQTNNRIANGRGELDTLADTIAVLNDDWFVKDEEAYKKAKKEVGDGWKLTSKWAFEGAYSGAFYDLAARSTELLDDYLIPALEKSEKTVGLFVSHDLVMAPLVIYASNKNIDMKYHETKKWINYLAGIAVVLKPDGTRVFYAVSGLDSGIMIK